jgi:hypothetical protein
MIETIIAIALMVFIGWIEWSHMRERRYLINTIIARHPNEARILNQEFIPTPPTPVRIPDIFEELDGFDGPVGI